MKGELIVDPNITDPDEFYAELLALHEGRSKSESDAINARLVLLLANHIGDRQILRQAFAAAARLPVEADGGASSGKRPQVTER